MSCVFCDIVSGNGKAYKIYENEDSMVILDVNPLAKGHCLAISKRHVQWWHDLEEHEISSLFNAAKVASEKIMKLYKPDLSLIGSLTHWRDFRNLWKSFQKSNSNLRIFRMPLTELHKTSRAHTRGVLFQS
jgi:galactose-1-phosphate uridylyltransferase